MKNTRDIDQLHADLRKYLETMRQLGKKPSAIYLTPKQKKLLGKDEYEGLPVRVVR